MADSTEAVDVDEHGARPLRLGLVAERTPDGALVESGLPADAYFAEGHDGQWIVVVPSEDLVMVRLGFTPVRDDDRVLSTAVEMVAALR